jgi:transcriptional regulator with XRE-family HTH domain
VAKIMDSASPGALFRVASRQNLTRQELAQKAKVDRKTVQKIDEGQPVKRETLEKVANALRVPVEHLKVRTDENVGDLAPHLEVHAAPGNLLLKKLSAAELPELLQGTGRLHWMLELPAIAPELPPVLEKLEDAVEGLRVSLNSVNTSPDHTLRSQLSRVGKVGEVAGLLRELHAERIAVLGATYLFWECSRDDTIDFYGRTERVAEYNSTQVAALCIDDFGLDSKRVFVLGGRKPPRYAEPGDTVVVDGVYLKMREEELDDDLL